jgi:hypothetical protein
LRSFARLFPGALVIVALFAARSYRIEAHADENGRWPAFASIVEAITDQSILGAKTAPSRRCFPPIATSNAPTFLECGIARATCSSRVISAPVGRSLSRSSPVMRFSSRSLSIDYAAGADFDPIRSRGARRSCV